MNTSADMDLHHQHMIHVLFLENDFKAIVDLVLKMGGLEKKLTKQSFDNADAWTAYRIGQAYAETGNPKNSCEYYAIAYQLAPLVLDFTNKYATALVAIGKNKDAKSLLERLVYEYPKSASALSNLGYLCLVVDSDTIRARKLYDQSLLIDPDYEQAIINKAGLWMMQQKNQQAVLLLNNYLKRRPKSNKVRELLNRIKPT